MPARTHVDCRFERARIFLLYDAPDSRSKESQYCERQCAKDRKGHDSNACSLPLLEAKAQPNSHRPDQGKIVHGPAYRLRVVEFWRKIAGKNGEEHTRQDVGTIDSGI